MKTKIILFLLCLATLNTMGQTNGTITRQRKTTAKKETQQRKTTQAAPKKTQPARQAQQQKPAAIRKDEPLVEGDPVVDPAVDDVFGICDGKVQPEEPDEVHHPVQLKPQMRAALGPQLLAIHGISPIISMY